ncbi:hypothetical protein [Methylocystis parvus]|uniref:hypothetical protein n=1 Tax=Methylocystis parvus TaxID=134 RepID=UPI003C75F98F
MRKIYISLLAVSALLASGAAANAFEAMLGGAFALRDHPGARHPIMVLQAGDIVMIDHCDKSWCAVTHGPHVGYIYMPRVLDGRVYGPHGDVMGVQDGGPAEIGASIVTAPINAAGDVLNAGVSVLQ